MITSLISWLGRWLYQMMAITALSLIIGCTDNETRISESRLHDDLVKNSNFERKENAFLQMYDSGIFSRDPSVVDAVEKLAIHSKSRRIASKSLDYLCRVRSIHEQMQFLENNLNSVTAERASLFRMHLTAQQAAHEVQASEELGALKNQDGER